MPAALEAICLKPLALKPEVRYHTAADVAYDVEYWLADEPVSEEALYFPHAAAATDELAARWADPNSKKVYFEHGSIRYRWLDRARGR